MGRQVDSDFATTGEPGHQEQAVEIIEQMRTITEDYGLALMVGRNILVEIYLPGGRARVQQW